MKDYPVSVLDQADPPPVTVERQEETSPFFLTCDHGGKLIPRSLGTLGLEPAERESHIAWDIGAAAMARGMSERLQAPLALQTYSRLVIDCNRPLDVPASIPTISEETEVPGNRDIGPDQAAARAREIFLPYHRRIASELDDRQRLGRPSVLVSVHSFTPVFKGVSRPWHVGVAYNRDPGFARCLLEMLAEGGELCLGDNQPYSISERTDYTVPVHGERRAIPCLQIEVRQDLIAEEVGQLVWASRLAELLERGYQRLFADGGT